MPIETNQDVIMDWTRKFKESYGEFQSLVSKCNSPQLSKGRLNDLVDYNISGGKKIRGALVAWSLSVFHSSGPVPLKQLESAYLVGWCVELLHAGFLVFDDIMDESALRRGKAAWHLVQKNKGFGLIGVNDGLNLYSLVKVLLHEIFCDYAIDSHSFIQLLRLFDEVSFNTACGQTLDMLHSKRSEDADFSFTEGYTVAIYEQITLWKTALYTFYLPVAAGMILAGVCGKNELEGVREILLRLGQYFQAQDDYLDCFGDPSVTGKVGSDIAEGKCSWFIVEALQRATPAHLKTLQLNYGKSDPHCSEIVRRVYEELDLPTVFLQYEEKMQASISQLVESHFPCTSSQYAFLIGLAENIFLRRK